MQSGGRSASVSTSSSSSSSSSSTATSSSFPLSSPPYSYTLVSTVKTGGEESSSAASSDTDHAPSPCKSPDSKQKYSSTSEGGREWGGLTCIPCAGLCCVQLAGEQEEEGVGEGRGDPGVTVAGGARAQCLVLSVPRLQIMVSDCKEVGTPHSLPSSSSSSSSFSSSSSSS